MTLARSVALASCVGLAAASPGYAQIAVTSPILVEHSAAPGETYRDTMTIHNASDRVQVVSLSLADYQFQADGSNSFDEPGSQLRSNSGWIALSQREVSVLPHADASVSYSVTVPSSVSLSGTYWSVALVEATRSAEASSDPTVFALAPRIRYAVQLATHIGSTGEPTLAFGTPSLERSALGLDIRHAGTRASRPMLRLEIYSTDGALAHSASAQRGLLYPGSSITQTFELPPMSPGDYTVLLLADVGTDQVQGTKFEVHVQ